MEQWRTVPGHDGRYEVSSEGRVRSLSRHDARGRRIRGRLMSINTNRRGYKFVKLSRDGVYQSAPVHRLVLMAFAGPPPEKHEALHGDGNPGNNNIANLRWGTRSENLRDAVRHGVHHWAAKTHCPQGHPYDGPNTYHTSDGRRMCRTCLRNRDQARRANKKAA